jgi:hypothetical protein
MELREGKTPAQALREAFGIKCLPAFVPPVDQRETEEETLPAQTDRTGRLGATTVGELGNLYNPAEQVGTTQAPSTVHARDFRRISPCHIRTDGVCCFRLSRLSIGAG